MRIMHLEKTVSSRWSLSVEKNSPPGKKIAEEVAILFVQRIRLRGMCGGGGVFCPWTFAHPPKLAKNVVFLTRFSTPFDAQADAQAHCLPTLGLKGLPKAKGAVLTKNKILFFMGRPSLV